MPAHLNCEPVAGPTVMKLHRNIVTFAFIDEHHGHFLLSLYNLIQLWPLYRNSQLVSHNLCNLLYLVPIGS